jgi:hypothetical protein
MDALGLQGIAGASSNQLTFVDVTVPILPLGLIDAIDALLPCPRVSSISSFCLLRRELSKTGSALEVTEEFTGQ